MIGIPTLADATLDRVAERANNNETAGLGD